MEEKVYKITTGSTYCRRSEKTRPVRDSDVAKFLLSRGDVLYGSPLEKVRRKFTKQEKEIRTLQFRIAEAKSAGGEPKIADMKIELVKLKALHAIARGSSDDIYSAYYCSYYDVGKFLLDYSESPTGDIASAFREYVVDSLYQSVYETYTLVINDKLLEISDGEIADVLLGLDGKEVHGSPITNRIMQLRSGKGRKAIYRLKIAILKKEGGNSELLNKLRLNIATINMLRDMRWPLHKSQERDFLVKYKESPTGDIAGAYEDYVLELARKEIAAE